VTRTAETGITWTTRGLLEWISKALGAKGIDSPRLCAELILSHVIGCERLRLYMETDRPATPLERGQLRELVGRALKHEPVQYLTGEAWFFGMPLHVDHNVLIPRPETETIVEHVIEHCRVTPGFGGKRGDGALIADIGTGSGAIAIALAKNLAGSRVVATDISEGALEVAKGNAKKHSVLDRIDFVRGDLLGALDGHSAARGRGSLDFLVSNPPYIPDAEWVDVAPNVKEHEPEAALRGGADGLRFVRPLIEGAGERLRSGGLLLIEIAESTAEAVEAIARSREELERVDVLDDFQGRARVLVAERV